MIVSEWICEKLFLKNITHLKGNIFLDTFFTPGNGLRDRYYSNYEDYLTDDEIKNIIISPTLIGFSNPFQLINIFKLISKSKRNIIIQNHLLTLKDRIDSLWSSIKYSSQKYEFPSLLGLNIESLCNAELENDYASRRLMLCINTMRFVELLNENGYQFEVLIDWNENQDLDKALNLSFHLHYPDCIRRGYRGYVQSEFENEKNSFGL